MASYTPSNVMQVSIKVNGANFPIPLVIFNSNGATLSNSDNLAFPNSILNGFLCMTNWVIRPDTAGTVPETSIFTGADGAFTISKATGVSCAGLAISFTDASNNAIMADTGITRPNVSRRGDAYPWVLYYDMYDSQFYGPSVSGVWRCLPEPSSIDTNVDNFLSAITYSNNVPIIVSYNGSTSTTTHPLNLFTAAVQQFLAAHVKFISGDPYEDGGETTTGGGEGTFSHTSVPVDIPGLPTTSAADTGFITLFNPSLTELRSLASYMWSSLFDVAGWQKLFADPMDAILGLSIVPVSVPAGASKEVKVGNIGTGINMTTAASQYVEVDCGSLNVEEYWGAYLDYAPYTKAELYLPYCGVHPIQIDDIMGRTVAIKYHVDVLSGSCVAFVKCGNTVLYTFAGQCSSSIPINANNWTNVVNGALSIAGSIGTMVATGGLSAPISAGTAVAAGAALASTAMTMKPQVERSGSMGGTAGMMGIQTPYLILTRPRQALPEDQNTYTGYPSYITSTLGDLTGWTTVSEIHLEGVPCTEGEAEEIVNILKSGVIL